jgi:hypothetical protein
MSLRQLFIRRVDANHAPLIEHIFRENYGELSSIEIIRHASHKKTNKYSARLFVEYWYNTQVSMNFVHRLEKKGSAKIMYNDPFAWEVMPDKNIRISSEDLILKNKQLADECERLREVARNFHHELRAYKKRCTVLLNSNNEKVKLS